MKENKPFFILVCGFTGAGKSFVANMIVKKINSVIIRSDVIRKELLGIPFKEHIYEEFEKGIYSSCMTEKVYKEMFKRAEKYLREGKNVILDASFLDKEKRDMARKLARKLNLNFLILWVEADENLIKERLEKRKDDVSDGRWEIYLKQKEKYEKPLERDVIFIKNEKKEKVENEIKIILKNIKKSL